MPVSYAIDPVQKLVTTTLWGVVTDDEVLDHNRRLRTDPAFDPGYRQLAHMTAITESRVTTNLINETSADQFFNPGTRRAFVATSDSIFGMARKYALQAEAIGQTIQVFRDLRKAEEWLEL